ncbi:MAG TPA: FadR/GntR family transcriptional regulator [Pseudogracilibacillus sp.]|nr:FadR/GntR family transcriptional regulator [Pseudogracilibacillus sp.]
MNRTARKKKLFEIVVDEIKVLIKADGLVPGDKLPTEKDLIEILDVSRTSLREALIVLQNSGYLNIIQGKGIFLKKELENESLKEDLDDETYLDYLHEARTIIECQLAKLAAERATDEDKNLLKEALNRMRNDHLPLKERIQADYDFHYRISDGAKNPILKEMLKQIDEKLYEGRSITLSFPKGRDKALNAHRLIYEAICKRDGVKAEKEMKGHIDEVYKAQKQMHMLKQKEKK